MTVSGQELILAEPFEEQLKTAQMNHEPRATSSQVRAPSRARRKLVTGDTRRRIKRRGDIATHRDTTDTTDTTDTHDNDRESGQHGMGRGGHTELRFKNHLVMGSSHSKLNYVE